MGFNKKGSVQQVFVYAVSTIVVAFVGILALNFLGFLGSDIENRVVSDFLSDIEVELSSIKNEFNSENVATFRVPGIVSKVAIVAPSCSQTYAQNFDGHYILLFDSQNQILDFAEVDGFSVQDGCFEVQDVDIMTLAFKNNRNNVIVEDLTS